MSKENLTQEECQVKDESGTAIQDGLLDSVEQEVISMTEQEIALAVHKKTTLVQISLGMLESFEFALIPNDPEAISEGETPFKQVKASTFRNEERDLIAGNLMNAYKDINELLSK